MKENRIRPIPTDINHLYEEKQYFCTQINA
jgi:hypothetical protein